MCARGGKAGTGKAAGGEADDEAREDEVAGAKEAGSPGAGWNVTVTVGTRMGSIHRSGAGG